MLSQTPYINCLEIEDPSQALSNSLSLNRAPGKGYLLLEYSTLLSMVGLDPCLFVISVTKE